jgi:hypothetical protein
VLDIKALIALATNKEDTFITLTDAVIKDLGGLLDPTTGKRIANPNEPLPSVAKSLTALKSTSYNRDETSPTVSEFSAYDATLGQLRLAFDEPVAKDTLDATKLTLRVAANEVGTFYELTGYETIEYSDAVRCTFSTIDSAVLGLGSSGCGCCTVRVFRQTFALAIKFHAFAPLQALACV